MEKEFTIQDFAKIAGITSFSKISPNTLRDNFHATRAIMFVHGDNVSPEKAWEYVKRLRACRFNAIISALSKLEQNRCYTKEALELVVKQM